ncbi:polysialyltransferase family glycosyltransferase, partial [Arthrobacter sp. H14]|uniref:polysialyltransferase family glycosyltransferase n=1 Tax=Arthrobacter sp. H14 TaxID=1312959 RepID=UPI0006888AE4
MTVLVVASTMYQGMSLAAAADAGLLKAEAGEERILVLANSSQVPEVTGRLQDAPGFDLIAARFDRVLDLAELIYPRRPQQFSPSHEELRMWATLLRSHWSLGVEPVRLVLDSVHVNPGIALARIFSEATLTVHSDGLMVYGPTRAPLGLDISQRLDALLYLDLVPGLQPQLLREHQTTTTAIPREFLRTVVDELAEVSAGVPTDNGTRTALILGQYLTELQLIDRAEEAELHRSMLEAAAGLGIKRCVFKPHPSAGRKATHDLAAAAAELGIEFVVLDLAVPAEVVLARLRPDAVVGAFSTAMATARFLFGIKTVAVGTELMLERLTPYENSNRIPVTIIDAVLLRGLEAPAEAYNIQEGQLQPLVDAVAYCMQPVNLAALRPQVMAYLNAAAGTDQLRYFKRRRLTALDLPGSLPAGRQAV